MMFFNRKKQEKIDKNHMSKSGREFMNALYPNQTTYICKTCGNKNTMIKKDNAMICSFCGKADNYLWHGPTIILEGFCRNCGERNTMIKKDNKMVCPSCGKDV